MINSASSPNSECSRTTLYDPDSRAGMQSLLQRYCESFSGMEKACCGFERAAVSWKRVVLQKTGSLRAPKSGDRKSGRSSKSPSPSSSRGHVVGIDIGGSNLRVALADMRGTLLGRWSERTSRTSSPAIVIEQIRKGVKHLLKQTSIPRQSLLAAAAGAPGVTDRDSGIVLATSYLGGWKNVPLRSLLQSALRVPAVVENDVRLGAIGENWLGAARGLEDFVFLAIGTGIATGIFVHGQLVHGSEWAAGEVGYMLVPGAPEMAAKSGEPGALESIIGGEGVKLQWLRSQNGQHATSPQSLSATEIFDRAQDGDPLAKSVLERTARTLAYAIYNISLVLNSSLYVLGGGVGMSAPLRDATQRILEEYSCPTRLKLALSSLGQDAQLMGTIRLALDKAESRLRSM